MINKFIKKVNFYSFFSYLCITVYQFSMEPKDVNIEGNEINDSTNEEMEAEFVSDIVDFSELINCITDYYGASPIDDDGSGDEWKKHTQHSKNKNSNVPEKVNKLVEKAFCIQLKRFIH